MSCKRPAVRNRPARALAALTLALALSLAGAAGCGEEAQQRNPTTNDAWDQMNWDQGRWS